MYWQRVLAAPLAVFAMLCLAACGGDDDDEGPAGDVSTATATASSDEAPDTTTSTATQSATAPADTPVISVADVGALGAILTNADGRTLYIFTNDTPGKSACNGSCASAWPPLTADQAPVVPAAPGEFTLITRDDGKRQVAYDGRPLYTYAADQKAGDTNGEGVGGVWFVAKAASGEARGAGQPTAGQPTPASSAGGPDPYGY